MCYDLPYFWMASLMEELAELLAPVDNELQEEDS